MTSFDYIVLVVVGISIVVSMMRGAVREIFSIVGLVAAFYVAKTYTTQLMPLLPENIPTEALRVLAAFLILFLSVWLIANLLTIALSTLIKKIGLNWLNRGLGGVFGLVKGLFIVSVMVLLAGLTSLPKDARWTNAMLSAPLEALVKNALPWLPQAVAKHIKYD